MSGAGAKHDAKNDAERIVSALAAYVVAVDEGGAGAVIYATGRARVLGLDGAAAKDVVDAVAAVDRERMREARRGLRSAAAHTTTVMLAGNGDAGALPVRIEERVTARHADGAPAEIVGVVGEASEGALESLRFLTDLLDTLPDPVFVKDRAHRWIALNEAFAQFVGRPRADLLNKTDTDYFPPEEVRVFWEHDDRVLESEHVDENEEHLTDAAGALHVIQTRKASFDDPSGQRVLVGVIRDVTARKRLEEEMLAVARAKTEFAANISHELRTPLNGILGMAQLLARRPLGAVEQEYLDVIAASGQALLALVDDVLDFSKIEAGRLELESHPYSPADVVEGACAVFAASAARRGVELVVRLAPDLPARLSGDAGRVRQIVVNLVSNAVKFTDRGEVVVDACVSHPPASAASSAQRVADLTPSLVVTVKDTGVGLDEAAKHRLFLPFTQADASITRRFGGTGLGLAISQRLASLMGGAIEAAGAPGHGSTFTLRIPAGVVEPAPSPPSLRSLKAALLRIENATVREHLRAELERCGIAVVAAPPRSTTTSDPGSRPPPAAEADGPDVVAFVDETASLSGIDAKFVVLVGAEPSATTPVAGHLVKPVRRARFEALLRQLDGTRADRPREQLRGRALVVDDSEVNARVLALMLEHAGLSAAVAHDGLSALAVLEREEFDVVLMDCQMPGLDGIEAARRIRARASTIPVIAVTADTTVEAIEQCMSAGMDAVLKKPVRVEDLVDVLARFVTRH